MAESWTHEQREQEVGPLALLRETTERLRYMAEALAQGRPKARVLIGRFRFAAADWASAVAQHSKKRLCCAFEVARAVADRVEALRLEVDQLCAIERANANGPIEKRLAKITECAADLWIITEGMAE